MKTLTVSHLTQTLGGGFKFSGSRVTSPRAAFTSSINETATKHTSEMPKGASQNCLGMVKHWQKVQCEIPKELMNFCNDIINNILSHDQLLDFAIKCDIPTNWVERAKEDYPHDSEMIVTKVFFEW